MSKLKAIILLGTLKSGNESSNTQVLCEYFTKHLEKNNVETEIIRLVDYDIRPGVYTKVGNDDWPNIFKKIVASDIVIFATPIWWDVHSSLIQRVIERLDEVHDNIMKTGKSVFANKVAGIVVTGDSDGAMHIIGSLTNFFIAVGFTIPPFPTLTVLWEGQSKGAKTSKKELLDYYEKTYASTAEKAAENLAFMARLLKKNPSG